MKYIAPPHIILRKALIQRLRNETFAKDIGVFIAKTSFGSSGLYLDGGALRTKISLWSRNTAMCALTEKVIFTDPFVDSQYNRWTSPHLDNFAAEIRLDADLILAAAQLKSKFLTSTQALLHGDLHTGSIMVKDGSTVVIDPEFAFYGPIGFDLGAIISNLFLSYFSTVASNDVAYGEFLLQQIIVLYDTFTSTFIDLWNNSTNQGEIYHSAIFCVGSDVTKSAQQKFLDSVFRDTLGFTGLKIIRRIVGIAHVEDLESIENLDQRSLCEKKSLIFARSLVIGASDIHSIVDVVDNFARPVYSSLVSPSVWPSSKK
jgi:5-methylthioribose kinase